MLLADSLPDRFGNALIDAWLATQGRGPESFNAVEGVSRWREYADEAGVPSEWRERIYETLRLEWR